MNLGNLLRGKPRSVRAWGLRSLIASLCVCLTLTAWAQNEEAGNDQLLPSGNYDARLDHNADYLAQPMANQLEALNFSLRNEKTLTHRMDQKTGVTRILYNRAGYLTEASDSPDLLGLALGFLHSNATALGLRSSDLENYRIADEVYTELTGATRFWFQQTHQGLPLYNGLTQVNINRDGRVLSVNNGFLADLGNAVNATDAAISAMDAIQHAAASTGIKYEGAMKVLSAAKGQQQTTLVGAESLSLEPIEANLMYLPIRQGDARMVWNFQIQTLDAQHWYDFTVDAQTGQVWTRLDWTVSEQYDVYPAPVESPIHTSPLPPSDGRQVVGIPNPSSSPLGWHDTGSTSYTIMRGNNVHAYDDKNNNNSPPSSQPNCGSALDCFFPLNLNNDPDTYVSAAVANLFYWNNVIHDITYEYGFDEPNGNFQVNNFGKGGAGNDDVRAEAQDGGGTNNANMATPSDGGRPRMQMYLWNQTNPRRDGDFDNGIIIHEYGHGISNRLVGGPSAASCLGNRQQPGEGLSDWWTLAYTGEVGDSGTDRRGIGTYALGQSTTGAGIRTQVYSTDPGLNTHTYQSIRNMAVPHGVGEVWAQVAWECYWALVDEHGFDANLYDAFGGAGNQRMMLYVVEGLKNTSCSPTFADVRDGIIQAATDNFNGEDVCRLWNTFAAFGLGIDADDASSGSTTVTNGFTTAPECGGTLPTIVGINVIHSSSTTTANRRAMPFSMPEDGTIDSVTMYHEGGSGQMILAIYDGTTSTPGNLLATTAATAVNSSAGWQTIPLTSSLFVNNGSTIWLAWVYENNPGIRYTSGTPGRADAGVGWSGGMPASYGASTQADFLYSIYADYTPGTATQYTLTTNTNGSGSIGLNPAGGTYSEGTVVSATATPAAGWQFDNWSGAASGSSNPVSVTMDANKTLTANFSQLPTYTLSTNTVGQGSVSLNPAGGSYTQGTVVSVTANPASGWAFSGWSGDLSGSNNPESITMDGNKNVTATFVQLASYTLTTNTVGSGSISLNPSGGTYASGTVVTVTANADSGFAFTGWSGDLSGSTNPTTITMDSNKSVTASFEEASATVGNTTVYGQITTTANRRAMPFTMPEDGTISSVAMYHSGGSGNMILAVYDGTSAPGTRLGVTASTPVSASAGFQTIALQSPVSAAGGSTVWLAWVYENNPGIAYQSGTPGRVDGGAGWSAGMPDPFGSSTQANFIYSIYANYSPGSLPTGTVGNTSIFGSSSVSANRRAQSFTMPQDGTLTSVSMYHEAGSGQMYLAVYDGASAPTNLLAVTPATAVSGSAGWQTINLQNSVFVSGGTQIWLAWVYQSNPGIAYQTGTPGRADAGVAWSGGMPDPFGSSTFADFIYSIYATYDTGGAVVQQSKASTVVLPVLGSAGLED